MVIAYAGGNDFGKRSDIPVEIFRIIDSKSGDVLQTFEGHTGRVNCVAFSEDGTRITSGSIDGTVRIWDATTANELDSFHHGSPVATVDFSPDGTRVLSGSRDLKVWQLNEKLRN